MKDFLELVRRRSSIRAFADRPVSEDLLAQVLEAGRLAPSACNLQPWHFVVVADPERLRALARCYGGSWLRGAPAIIAAVGDPELAWRRKDGKSYLDVDLAIAVDHMTLAACDLGLGTCWIGAFAAARAAEVLAVPPEFEVIALLPIGHPAEEGRAKERKPLAAIVHRERFGDA